MTRLLVIAGVASGVGKTSITLGLLEALRRRGLAVQAFKVGPDFIDPAFHALVTGRPSYNLDGWMCGREGVLATVARACADVDVAVVEGVMGCFDGLDATSEAGSTAEIAKWLGAPVVLVVDVSAQSRSAAAVVLGFERFDPGLRVAGVIANRVGGEAHGRWVRDAIRAHCGAEPLGAIPHDAGLVLPERHLGLVTAAEGPLTAELRRRLADAVERSLDLDRLLALATPLALGSGVSSQTGGDGEPSETRSFWAHPGAADRSARHPRIVAGVVEEGLASPPVHATARPRARIGVARDAAFQFYYAENLELLCDAGAELVFWSPLADAEPPDVDGLYLGGGYPELHARTLAENVTLRKAIRRLAEAGTPIYAECGGLMFLAESLEDLGGTPRPMVGLLPARVRMTPRRLTLGYVEVTLTADTPLGSTATVARGQEFHASTLDPVPASVPRAYRVASPGGAARGEGYLVGRTLMSYVHLHFASNPELARAFVAACVGVPR